MFVVSQNLKGDYSVFCIFCLKELIAIAIFVVVAFMLFVILPADSNFCLVVGAIILFLVLISKRILLECK